MAKRKPAYNDDRRKIKTAKHSPRKSYQPKTVTVIEGPLTKIETNLEEIARKASLTLEFTDPIDSDDIKNGILPYDGRKVYLLKKGSDEYLHGTLVAVAANFHLGLTYKDNPTMIELHKYEELRKMLVERRDYR